MIKVPKPKDLFSISTAEKYSYVGGVVTNASGEANFPLAAVENYRGEQSSPRGAAACINWLTHHL